MSASPPLRQPCPPGACVCERERLEAPGADRRILLLTRQEEQRLAARWKPCAAEDWNTCCGAWRNNWASACGSPGLRRGAQHARHPHALRGAAGALPQDPPGDSAAIRRGLEKRRKSPTPCSTPTTCCATPEGTERQEKDVAQDLGGLQEYRRITPMALFALQARSGCRRAPGPPESLAGLATAPEFSSPTPPARRRTSPAGGAGRHRTGCAVRRGGCRRGFPCRAAIGAAQGLLQLAGTAGRALAPTVEALPLMVCRVAALPGHRPRRAGVRAGRRGPAYPERSAATPGRSAPGCRRNARRYRPAPRPVRPRPLPLPARPSAAPAEMTEQAKHQALLVDRLRHMVVHARRQAASRSASEALAVMARIGSPAKRPSARILRVASRPSISGICMSISTASNGTLASSTC